MKRRKLIIGIGVLATGSGAAALTGATISNSVNPSADFRVNVEGGLAVEKGANFTTAANSPNSVTEQTTSNNIDYITSTSTSDANVSGELDGKTGFAVVADEEVNGALSLGLAIPMSQIPTSNGTGTTLKFPKLLQITNNSGSNEDVSILYDDNVTNNAASTTPSDNGFADADITGLNNTDPVVSETGNASDPPQLSYDQAAHLFKFVTNTNTTQISASGADATSNTNQDAANSVTLNANGGSEQIDLNVDITTTIGGLLHDYAEYQSLKANGGHFSIIDDIYVGTTQ